ncbi:MAG: type II toxin-antitoxin system RelE/ParE family toxin [Bryobacterales bacterium]|nr:type II toxin-antitoxin system RelE/ParE family toxin [Bryobacterales bacterium]
MKVVWSRRAVQHLVALREYIGNDSEQNAALVAGRILDAVDLWRARPELGRPGRVAGTRELVVPDTPYIIPYRIRQNRLELMAVFHGRQRWPAKL